MPSEKILEQKKAKETRDELERVYNSRGHKMLEKLYKLEGFIVPPGSRRRFILKLILKILHHPVIYLKKLTLANLKKVLSFMTICTGRLVLLRYVLIM